MVVGDIVYNNKREMMIKNSRTMHYDGEAKLNFHKATHTAKETVRDTVRRKDIQMKRIGIIEPGVCFTQFFIQWVGVIRVK